MQAPECAFLMRVAELPHEYGTPAQRHEHLVQKLARALRVEATFPLMPPSLS